MRRLGQPMQFQTLRRSVIDVYIKMVPQNVSYFFDRTHAVKLQDIIANNRRAVGTFCTSSKTSVGLDVDGLLRDRQRRAQD